MSFDKEEAKKYLSELDRKEKERLETMRKSVLQNVVAVLKEEFHGTATEIFLVGSILKPGKFNSNSDVDVVVKNYSGDKFDLRTKLEGKIGRDVEIIPYETCSFQEFISTEGLKVQ